MKEKIGVKATNILYHKQHLDFLVTKRKFCEACLLKVFTRITSQYNSPFSQDYFIHVPSVLNLVFNYKEYYLILRNSILLYV